MIEESVEVIAIEGDTLVLQAQRKTSCQSCSVQKGCGTSVLSQWLGKKTSEFRVENTTNAQIGDSLVVGIAENSLLQGSLLVYFLPLLTLIIAAAAMDWWLSPAVAARDLWIIASGVVGILSGVYLARIWLSALYGENLRPVILRKVIEHGKLPPLSDVG